MDLFSPIKVGPHTLANRVAMAPLARARCGDDRAPNDLVCEYYTQRSGAGLIVSEASSVSPMSVSRPYASAIYGDAHMQGWTRVADAVHAAGGIMFQQIYHIGRKSDPSRMPGGAKPVAPSEVAAKGQVNGLNGPVDFATPRAREDSEIPGVIEEFRRGAAHFKAAGMDGVEIHGANAFLVDQFLKDVTNRRTDGYGGSVENRARFLLEVVEAVADVWGADRVGIRLSPHSRGDGIGTSDSSALYEFLAKELDGMSLAYIHLVEGQADGIPQSPAEGDAPLMGLIRENFSGPLIVNGGYQREAATKLIETGQTDMVAFGSLFIANPDLVERFRQNAEMNEPDRSSFHVGGAEGYTDYPFLAG